jgi:hypothetical protein
MAETQVEPDQGEQKEPWDYQEEGGEEGGGQEPQARRIQPPTAESGGEESPQMEQTFPPPAEQGEGQGGATQALGPWIEILIEVGMVLLKKAQDQGLIQPGQIKEITERHGVMP